MINWIKKNWLVSILILLVLYLFSKTFLGINTLSIPRSQNESMSSDFASLSNSSIGIKSGGSYVAPSSSLNRLIIQDTNMSLLVSDVSKTIKDIENKAKELGGFLVNSNVYKPESQSSGTIVIRVPEEKRSEALESFKKMAVRVVSESVSGRDVTDQYSDLEARLKILNQTKAKYEQILDKAVSVTELLNVERELTNLQSQIDSVIGQQKYYEETAKLTKIAVSLSTDELALPYAPDNVWRPAVIFKEAVRSLISSVRDLGSMLIWVFVYIPIWLPILLVVWLIRRRRKTV